MNTNELDYMNQKFKFKFQGIVGSVSPSNFVSWGNANFQIEAAKPELRAAIEAARKEVEDARKTDMRNNPFKGQSSNSFKGQQAVIHSEIAERVGGGANHERAANSHKAAFEESKQAGMVAAAEHHARYVIHHEGEAMKHGVTDGMEKKFVPTATMVAAAEDVFKTMAFLETIRPIVLKYQTEILAKGQWHIRPEYADRLGDTVILDPKHSYLMSEEDFAVYSVQCKVARDKAGLCVEHDGNCPLLVAENLLSDAKRALINVMEPVTKISADKILSAGMKEYNSYIELTLQLLAPFVNPSLKKPSAPSAAAGFDESFAEVVEELRESHPDLEDSETAAKIKENVRDDFQTTGDALQDQLQLRSAVEKEIERVEFTDKLRM